MYAPKEQPALGLARVAASGRTDRCFDSSYRLITAEALG